MRKVAVLRPEPGASATLERARALGLDAFALPLFSVAAVDWEVPEPGGFDAILLTSANALRHGGAGLDVLRALPAYAVGEATAAAARDAGFDIAATGDAGLEQLLKSIDPDLRLVHLCGLERTEAGAPRQSITAIPVYEARPVGDIDGLERLQGCVALVHSPRAGRRLAELVADRDAIAIAAISTATAEAAGDGWERVEAAANPEDGALLALARKLCNTMSANDQ